jgi:glycosyltransferase involved in cell wall biosynthesis
MPSKRPVSRLFGKNGLSMSILFFAYVNLDLPNAPQTHTLGLLRGLVGGGAQVDALIPRPRHHLPWPAAVNFHFLGAYPGGRRYIARDVFLGTLRLMSLCRRQRYDAIYARQMDMFPGPALCSRIFGVPLFLEIDDNPVAGDYPQCLRGLIRRKISADLHQAAGLIVPSLPRCRILTDSFGIPAAKVHLVLNGTDPLPAAAADPRQAKARLGLPAGAFCLGYVGSIFSRYDFPAMLQAMALLIKDIPLLYFILVGGPDVGPVEAQARALGLGERIKFLGFIPQERFGEVLPAMDLGLMNLTPEGVSLHGPVHTKLASYAWYRVPVITAGYSLAGYPEELQTSLFLVPPGDSQALADLIGGLFQDPAARQQAAGALHEFAVQKLTWDSLARDILSIMAR